jgi:hypothetical protein
MQAKERKAVRLNLRLTAKQVHELKRIALSRDTSVSALVRKGIEWAIKQGGSDRKEN